VGASVAVAAEMEDEEVDLVVGVLAVEVSAAEAADHMDHPRVNMDHGEEGSCIGLLFGPSEIIAILDESSIPSIALYNEKQLFHDLNNNCAITDLHDSRIFCGPSSAMGREW